MKNENYYRDDMIVQEDALSMRWELKRAFKRKRYKA